MINVHIIEDKITSATGVWFYASKLLKDNDLINSGKNQYILVPGQTHVKTLSDKITESVKF